MAGDRARRADPRRADRRHRHRLEVGDRHADPQPRQIRQGDPRAVVGTAGAARRLRPHPGDVGRAHRPRHRPPRPRRRRRSRTRSTAFSTPSRSSTNSCRKPGEELSNDRHSSRTRQTFRARQLARLHHLYRLRGDLPRLRRDARRQGLPRPQQPPQHHPPDGDHRRRVGDDDLRAQHRRDRPVGRRRRGPRLGRHRDGHRPVRHRRRHRLRPRHRRRRRRGQRLADDRHRHPLLPDHARHDGHRPRRRHVDQRHRGDPDPRASPMRRSSAPAISARSRAC